MGALILLLIGFATALFYYLHRKMNYWQRRGVPCLKPSYLLGNLDGVGEKIHATLNLQLIYENFKDEHKFCGFYLLQSPRLLLIDLDVIKNVIIKDFHYFADRGVFHDEENDPLSAHLFAIEGEKWKNLRNKLSVTFTSGRMKMMYPIIEQHSKGFVNLVGNLSSGSDGIDIKNVCTRFTADVIGSCGFGIECHAMRDENSEMVRMGEFFDIKDTWTKINFFFVNVFVETAKKFKLKVTPKFIEDFFLPMIKQTFEYREKSENRNDFLSLLMQIKKYGKLKDEEMEDVGTLTFNEIAAQAFIFFIAGFETSSTTMSMALYELAYRHDIQSRLRDEIENVVARHDGKISYDSLKEMTYLDQVVNETLRLYSPIGQLFRICLKDYKVPGTDFTIEKGTSIFIPTHAIHHDSRYYYDPELFNPDRFAADVVKKRPKFSFLPFGEGPRNCIGERFGLMQTKLGIATLIKNFKLSFHEHTRYPLILDCKSMVVTSLKTIRLNAERI